MDQGEWRVARRFAAAHIVQCPTTSAALQALAVAGSAGLIALAFRQGFAHRGDPVHRAAARWLGASTAVAFSIAMYAFLVSLVYGAQGISTSYRWISIPAAVCRLDGVGGARQPVRAGAMVVAAGDVGTWAARSLC